jgi:hypothetical protein
MRRPVEQATDAIRLGLKVSERFCRGRKTRKNLTTDLGAKKSAFYRL